MQKEAKEKIKKLVERYENLSEAEKKKYNEQQTKDHFIRPLFEALGWDFEKEVWPETDVSGKRVDYSFKIDGITRFYLEAKAMSVNLDEERWAQQAIGYSWHKSVPWVILTDFEGIKVFNTEWDEPDIQSCRFFEISWKKYLTSEKLWWLSKEAFQKGVLDKEADELGRRPKKIIDDQLAADLIRWRELLFKDLAGFNPKIDKKKISKYVQKILDRLIFIRTLEARKIEDVILQPLIRDWNKKGNKTNQLLFSINKVFHKMARTYDSGLFEEGKGKPYDHLGEKLDAMDVTFVDIINELYKTEGKGIRYNFDDIPADIFGNIYEQYLGYIQQEEIKEKKTSKRKSQGIYYTPRYIVNYIVKNTLGEVLKNQTPDEIKNLKILDPACGSGSFLIVAYQALLDYWEKQKGNQIKEKNGKLRDLEKAFKKRNGHIISPQEKMRILLNNIFGVDLDEEAVELAKLNLLLKMVGAQIKLPKLANNIHKGNSLISGQEKELKKYFGKNWKDKKPFNWEENFRDVFGNKELQPLVCPYHITWVTHNSRVSERMIEYKVKKGPGLWLNEKEEVLITGFIRDIVKKDNLRVLAFNICGDHIHMFLVCAPDEIANIVRKLKGKSAQKYKEYLKINKKEKFHLWAQKFSQTIIRPPREGKSHFYNAIEYIKRNREKHNLPANKGLQPLVTDMVYNIDSAFAPQYQGGFDVIIGNPPYIDSEELVREDKNFRLYCADKYESAKGNWDIFCVFIQKGIDLLKEGGYFGMIIPNKLLSADYANSIREIIKKYSVIAINDYSKIKVFGASVYPIVIIIKKVKPDKNHNIVVNSYKEDNKQIKLINSKKVKQAILGDYKKSWSPIFDYTKETNFVDKICKKAKRLNELCFIHGAATVNEAYQIKEIIKNLAKEKNYFKFINTGTIDRYTSLWDSRKTQYIKSAYIKPIVVRGDLKEILPKRYKESEKNKIIVAGMIKNFECFIDEKGEYLAGKSTTIIERDKIDLKFILALLNSKLLTFIYKNIFNSLSLAGGYLRVGAPQIKELPIIVPPKKEVDKISGLADKMLKLNKEIQKLDPIMDEEEYNEIKEEIEKVDREIDERVFELYGLTEEEIKIIESN